MTIRQPLTTRSATSSRRSAIETFGSQRAARCARQDLPHPLQDRPRSEIAGKVVLLAGIVAHAKQFFAHVALAANVRPVAVGQRTKRPAGLEHLRGVRIFGVKRDHLGKRSIAISRVTNRRSRPRIDFKPRERLARERRTLLAACQGHDRRRQVS